MSKAVTRHPWGPATVTYQELLPLLPGMALALPKDGVAADLALLRTLTEPLPGDALPSVQLAFAAAERLVSPDVMPLLEHTAAVGHVTAAYPWRDGLPLAGALARAREAGVMPTPQVTGRLMSEALGALAALHTHKAPDGNLFPLAHGAFRADSLWLGFDGRLQLSDAGFSMAQSMVEQPAWAARSPKADVAQAGVLMHMMLTGAMPHGGTANGGHDPRTVNPTVPEQLAFLVIAATDPNPDNRPRDAAELKEQWDAAVAMLGGMSMHGSVSRWLCTIFPSNHPLVEAMRRVLVPLGAGNGLPINAGPILSNPRLAPIQDVSAPRLTPVPDLPRPPPPGAPVVSAPRLTPVPDSAAPVPQASVPRAVPVVDAAAPAPQVSAPRAAPVLDPNAPVPTVSQSRAAPMPVTGVAHATLAPVVDAPAPAAAATPQDDAALEAAFLGDAAAAASPVTAPAPITAVTAAAPPVTSGAVAPVTSGAVAPVVLAAAAPMTSGAVAPVTSGAVPPVVLAAAAPMTSGAVAPVTSGAVPPVVLAAAAPMTSGAVAPVTSGAVAPVAFVAPPTTSPGTVLTPAGPMPAAPLTAAGTPIPPSTPARRTQRRRALTDPALAPVPAPAPAPAPEPAPDELDLDAAPPPPKRGGPPPAAIAGVGMLLGGVAVLAALRYFQTPPPPPPQTAPVVQAPAPPPPPDPTPPAPPPEKQAKAPPSKPRKQPRTGNAPAPADEEVEMATLTVNVTPWANVWVDGKKVGRTPLKPLKLRPGKHVIKFENPDYKVSRTEKVDVQAGMFGELTVTFTPGG